jgi:Tfp pilus assembly protein PilF
VRTADLLLQDALLKLDARNTAAARASLEETLKRYPQDTRALDVLVQTYVAEQQASVATRKVREHAAAHPKSPTVQHYAGMWLQRHGSPAEARAAFEAARAANQSFWMADLAIASLDIGENRLDSARQRLTPLTSHPQAGPSAQLLLASTEEKSNNHSAAVVQYRNVLVQQPDNIIAMNNLAYTLAEHANAPDEALKYAQRAKELAPENPTVDDTIGWVYFKKGIYSSAVQYLESSVKRAPTTTRHIHLALAYAKRGDTARAREQMQAASKLSPESPAVIQAEKLLAGQ